ncbi:uncharacterized protein MYCGRDRAFT_106886 [Zymoseptoria tritici IPO323]|uniref:FHA domain-containing protein n=1 Tax=Zymoseptoria tritici (strain CBS 115943 / IPO323) TaxID=336722 RepID=F9WXM3_ZYMTI|nr:uncharacterized protein MYCGRDRAFT_106886 [Zymoseptoria tritici IPO323]EGP92630.1 hypothetical protein MYCGRDRAFT_106886 [Zymoseptoria tritici IPO323]
MPPLVLATMTSSSAVPSATNAYSVTVRLESTASTDKRILTLSSGSPRTIGRASRTKIKDLKEAQDNALFDCPVVSRQHAELRATNAWLPSERQITITDRSSMHGTYVNSKRLRPGMPFTLVSGDVIKLGERVTQGELQRGFRVPSVSDASDLESDSMSFVSDQEEEDTSAQTTPEDLKMKLGSQQAPIDLDTGSASPSKVVSRAVSSKVINLDDEDSESDDGFCVPGAVTGDGAGVMPPSGQESVGAEMEYSVSEDEDQQDDLASEANSKPMAELDDEELADMGCFALRPLDDVDEVDGFEYEEDDGFDDEGNDGFNDGFSDSGSDDQSDNEEQDRELSPELGRTSFDEDEHVDRTETISFAPVVSQSQPAAATLQKPRYDPVRSSQPPAETNTERFKSKNYTYGYPDFGRVTNLATDFDHSSRFDIGPTGLYEPLSQFDGLFDPFALRGQPPYEQRSMGGFQPAPQFHFADDPNLSRHFDSHVARPAEPSAPTMKNRISIDELVDNIGMSVPRTTANAAVSMPTASSNTNKRKAEEMTAGEAHPTEPPTKKTIEAPVVHRTGSVVVARASTERAKLNKRRVIQKAALAAGKVMAGAALGTVGSIALLSSPLATQLCSWLA